MIGKPKYLSMTSSTVRSMTNTRVIPAMTPMNLLNPETSPRNLFMKALLRKRLIPFQILQLRSCSGATFSPLPPAFFEPKNECALIQLHIVIGHNGVFSDWLDHPSPTAQPKGQISVQQALVGPDQAAKHRIAALAVKHLARFQILFCATDATSATKRVGRTGGFAPQDCRRDADAEFQPYQVKRPVDGAVFAGVIPQEIVHGQKSPHEIGSRLEDDVHTPAKVVLYRCPVPVFHSPRFLRCRCARGSRRRSAGFSMWAAPRARQEETAIRISAESALSPLDSAHISMADLVLSRNELYIWAL